MYPLGEAEMRTQFGDTTRFILTYVHIISPGQPERPSISVEINIGICGVIGNVTTYSRILAKSL
jgi:hypothetical protein